MTVGAVAATAVVEVGDDIAVVVGDQGLCLLLLHLMLLFLLMLMLVKSSV